MRVRLRLFNFLWLYLFTAEIAENERGITKPSEDWNGLKTLRTAFAAAAQIADRGDKILGFLDSAHKSLYLGYQNTRA